MLAFGPTATSTSATGDGGGGGDPDEQRPEPRTSLLGKLLRLDVESPARQSVRDPADNPFARRPAPGARSGPTGCATPGASASTARPATCTSPTSARARCEEIDFQPAASAGGENYGWRLMEGTHCYNPPTRLRPGRADAAGRRVRPRRSACSVTGGYVYRGATYPRMRGVYFYGDFCSGRIWGLTRDAGGWTSAGAARRPARSISSFGEDEAGELYLADYAGAVLPRDRSAAAPAAGADAGTGHALAWRMPARTAARRG